MSYLVLDLETTIKKSYGRTANPLDTDNKIIVAAYLEQGGSAHTIYNPDGCTSIELENIFKDTKFNYIVGHNLKFDLLYMWKYPWFREKMKTLKIWDTMLAEYIITGQQHKYASLNDCSIKYGGTVKDDRIKEFWKAGKDTTEIPSDMLREYAEYDIINTEIVFKAQVKQARELGLMPLIGLDNLDLLSSLMMEWNGCAVDGDTVDRLRHTNLSQLVTLPTPKSEPQIPAENINWNSKHHLNAIFFGGAITVTKREPLLDSSGANILFKSGPKKDTIKEGLVDYEYVFPQLSKPKEKWKTASGQMYKVDNDVLPQLIGKAKPIVDAILHNRLIEKQVSTYYDPLKELTYEDGILHAEYNLVSTNTGRWSGKNPNLQNIPRAGKSQVKECFVSRFQNGTLIEADASQLEIVVQAFLAQDDNMINDIWEGIDFHCKRLAYKEKREYEEVYRLSKVDKIPEWEARRTRAKEFSFQQAYGAGANAISEQTGLTVDEVKELMLLEKELYPQVNSFNNENLKLVKYSRVPSENRTALGRTAGIGQLISPTGRILSFTETDSPDFLQDRGIFTSFTPTQIKNYPIQSFANSVLSVVRARLYRLLLTTKQDFLMINTVHDSILFDSSAGDVLDSIKVIDNELSKVSEELLSIFKIKTNVPFRFDYSIGKSWGTMKKVEL